MKPLKARSRRILERLLLAMALFGSGALVQVRAWNPYDTDSADARGDPDPWASASPVTSREGASRRPAPAQSGGWSVPADDGNRFGAGAAARYHPGDDAAARPDAAPPPMPGHAGPWRSGSPSALPDGLPPPAAGDDEWAARERTRYRFRGDPESTDAPADTDGWRYRPLSEKERARQGSDAEGPRWRDRDLQPQGPSWGLEDEGSAVGYHPDDPQNGRPGP